MKRRPSFRGAGVVAFKSLRRGRIAARMPVRAGAGLIRRWPGSGAGRMPSGTGRGMVRSGLIGPRAGRRQGPARRRTAGGREGKSQQSQDAQQTFHEASECLAGTGRATSNASARLSKASKYCAAIVARLGFASKNMVVSRNTFSVAVTPPPVWRRPHQDRPAITAANGGRRKESPRRRRPGRAKTPLPPDP